MKNVDLTVFAEAAGIVAFAVVCFYAVPIIGGLV